MPRKCRREGALLAVDVYQPLGTVPVSVAALGAAVGGVLKWLCGGPGGAFLWVRPDLRSRLEPSLTGWMAHPAPFDFDPPPMRWRDDAFRFLIGTPPIPALYAASEGPRIVREAGIDAIRAKSLRGVSRAASALRDRLRRRRENHRPPESPRSASLFYHPDRVSILGSKNFCYSRSLETVLQSIGRVVMRSIRGDG